MERFGDDDIFFHTETGQHWDVWVNSALDWETFQLTSTARNSFSSQMISYTAIKQRKDAKQFCSGQSDNQTHRVLEDLYAPQKPSEKSFKEIKQKKEKKFPGNGNQA